MFDLIGFERFLVLGDRHRNTILQHIKMLRYLSKHLTALNKDHIDSLFITMKARGVKGKSLNKIVDTLRVYGKFSNNLELQSIPYFKEQETTKMLLTDDEIRAIYNCPPPPRCEKHSWLLFNLYFKCVALSSARCGEIANLRREDIDLGSGMYLFRNTKTGVPRRVPIAEIVLPEIKERLAVCGDRLFVTSSGATFSDRSWIHAFNKRKEILGITRKGITLYSLRHSAITNLLNEGANVFVVKDLAGHSNLETTMHYYHLTTKDKKKALNKLPLISSNLPASQKIKLIAEQIKAILTGDDIEVEYQEKDGYFKVVLSTK